MKLIDGKALKEEILLNLKKEIERKKLKPSLAIILVGDNPASLAYIRQKQKAAQEIDANCEVFQFPDSETESTVLKRIQELNKNPDFTGIIVQLPLPESFDAFNLTQAVSSEKDVDGLNPDSTFKPATPLAVLEILKHEKVQIKGKTVVIFGQSRLVGAPLKVMLEEEGAWVLIIDIDTAPPVSKISLQGDILISAVGKSRLITVDLVKEGAVVIDVGINRDNETGKLVGDVDFDNVKEKASLITPVPGGVGPMTVAMLMKNLVKVSEG